MYNFRGKGEIKITISYAVPHFKSWLFTTSVKSKVSFRGHHDITSNKTPSNKSSAAWFLFD